MKKRSLKNRIRYRLDRLMSSGPLAMSLLLFIITGAIVFVIGLLGYLTAEEGSLLYQLWFSLMYTLDPGNLASVSTENIPYLLLMFLSTLCGLCLTSVLIGIITTGVEDKLSDLRKGTSVVQEDDHTVIIGFDNNTYAILRELIEANANKKNACIVVLGVQSKEEMEDAIAAHIPDTRTTRIICRSGHLHRLYALERCSVETCRSVIVNVEDDAETVKILLALTAYVKDKKLRHPDLRFVASLQDKQYMEVAKIAAKERADNGTSKERVDIVPTKEAIARIIANTCRQHGLSQVLTELFNFSGDELYFETVPQLQGKTFREAVMSFSNAVVMGLLTNGEVKLNPPMDTIIGEKDKVVLLERDDGEFDWHPAKTVDESKIRTGKRDDQPQVEHLLVLGSNDKLPIILAEYDLYVHPGTNVVIVDDDFDEEKLGEYQNLEISICKETINRQLLCQLLEQDGTNILLMNDDSLDSESSDSQTLLRLILLRDIADNQHRTFSVTTEMRSVDNQRLASQARVDDFVIGSNFISLLLAQISEDANMMAMIKDLLDEDGSELYMKPVSDYVAIGEPVDSYILTESAARRGEIYMGYRHNGEKRGNVVINPDKNETVVFGEKDQIVVVAEN